MKKILFILCATLALAGCQKGGITGDIVPPGVEEDKSYTFEAKIEAIGGAQTTAVRYIMELYEGSLAAKPTKILNANGSFEVKLKNGVEYTCLFWADNGATEYNASDLQNVSKTDEATIGTTAYFAKSTVNTLTFNGAIILHSAVAQINFTENNGISTEDNTLVITYPYTEAKFNVNTGTVSYSAGETAHTIRNIPQITAGAIFASDFVLAPTAKSQIKGLRLKLNTLPEKTITTIDIQANIKTEVSEEYEVPMPKVLDFFYSDRSFSSTYISTKTCVGIIYWLDPTNPMSGKIISLDDGKGESEAGLTWEGALNWRSSKVLPEGMSWRLPARDELQHIYSAYNGATPSTWESLSNVKTNKDARVLFNNALTFSPTGNENDEIGTRIVVTEYWSSTDFKEPGAPSATHSDMVNFYDGFTTVMPKSEELYARAISNF